MPRLPRHTLAASILLAAAACSSGPGWVNASRTSGQAEADLSACRKVANSELGPEEYIPPGMGTTGDPMKLVDQSNMRKHYDRLVASCMVGYGYRRAP